MRPDSEIALERVQSEALATLMSIQGHRDVDQSYFDRLRDAVSAAGAFFVNGAYVPEALLNELKVTAQILRNEATAFPGRTVACLEMSEWLDARRRQLSNA